MDWPFRESTFTSARNSFRLQGIAVRSALLSGLIVLLAVFHGCGKSDSPSPPPPAEAPDGDSAADPSPPQERDRKHPVVRLETNLGAITIRLDAEKVPGTVTNFLNYVNAGFYRDTIFHFVDPGRMILGGGYSNEHQLKPTRSDIRNEAHDGGKNLRGTIAMARRRGLIDSANSQFFINLEDAPERDYRGDTPEEYGYCVFGEVIEGLEVADRISRAPTSDLSHLDEDLQQTPQPAVVISSIKIVR